jgi:hypothetical protein
MNGSGIFSPLVVLFLIILAGAVFLGGLVADKKPFESSQDMYAAYATATVHALNVQGKQAAIEATETPRALQAKLNQTQTVVVAQATQAQLIAQVQAGQTVQAANAQGTITRQAFNVQATETVQAVSANATRGAVQDSATQTAMRLSLALAQSNATQTALASESQKRMSEVGAQRTEVAGQQTRSTQYADATATRVALAVLRDKEERDNANVREAFLTGAIVLGAIAVIALVSYVVIATTRTRGKLAEAKAYTEQRRMLEVQAAVQEKQDRKPGRAVITPLPTRPRIGEGEDQRKAA